MSTRTVSVNLVANVGSYISGMNTAAGATLRLGESAKTSTTKAKGGFDLASKGALLMGAAVVGGLGMAIGKSMEFEKSMSAISAATHASGAELAKFRDLAMKAGADTQYSATEAADAITEMSKAGVSAKDIMGGGLSGALSLAAAGQLDVADAAGIASVAMTQFNLSGKDLPHVADLLAAGAGKAMGSVEDLGAALNQSGLIASAAGLSIEDTTGTLAAFANAGLIGSDAGTSFKTMLQALQAPSGKAADLMDELGINMYDAQGNMLGTSQMAGVLQDKLSGLTEEQRNSALATIFGTDAVRAANVLYKEGASGIQEWIDKTNDQGYAAKTAAALNDNLAGDIERLGGAFDTLMISMGSGSQGPLRFLVQTFTDLLDVTGTVLGAIGDLPTPVLAAATAFGVLYLTNGPLSGFLSTVGTNISNVATKAGSAVKSVGGFKSALSGIASSISPASIAITGITMLVPTLIDGFQSMTGASDQAKTAQEGFAEALRATNGVMDENARKAAQAALVNADLVGVFDRAGISAKDAIDGLLGNAGAQDRVNAALQDYITKANTTQGLHGKNAEAARIARNDYEELAKTLGMTADEAKFFAGAVEASTGSTTAAAAPTSDFATKMEDVATAADDAKKATNQFKLSLDILTGAHVSMIEVESSFQSALANATGAMKGMSGAVLDGSGKLNLQSEAGRKAADVLLGVRDSGNQLISTMIQQGASTDAVTRKDAELRASFIKSAQQMGISEGHAKDLADQILGIPASRKTTITADTSGAEAAVSKFMQQHRVITIGTRTVTARVGTTYQQAGGGYAHGGYTGDGGKYEPKGVVHGGEFVFTKEQTAKAGVGALSALAGSLEGYARGGWVGGSSMGSIRIPAVADTSGLSAGLNAAASAAASAMEPNYSGSATASSSALVAFGHMLQRMGARVSEHPAFGGVTPGAHVRGSKHYLGKAIDVNTRPGTSAAEQRELAPMAAMARAAGFQTIFMAPGHYNHLHVASYKTGTPYVPKDGYAYLHQGERVVPKEQNLRSREFSGGGRGGVGAGSANVTIQARVFVGTREITDIARVEAQAVVAALDGRQAINARSWQ